MDKEIAIIIALVAWWFGLVRCIFTIKQQKLVIEKLRPQYGDRTVVMKPTLNQVIIIGNKERDEEKTKTYNIVKPISFLLSLPIILIPITNLFFNTVVIALMGRFKTSAYSGRSTMLFLFPEDVLKKLNNSRNELIIFSFLIFSYFSFRIRYYYLKLVFREFDSSLIEWLISVIFAYFITIIVVYLIGFLCEFWIKKLKSLFYSLYIKFFVQ